MLGFAQIISVFRTGWRFARVGVGYPVSGTCSRSSFCKWRTGATTVKLAHGSWFTIHGSRFTIHGSRFTVHGSRFTIRSSRFTIRREGGTVGRREGGREGKTERERGREGGR